YFKYMYDLLKEKGAPHIKIFGGGGGVIVPWEIKELHDYGISWIFSPEDGREMGLQGMINKMVEMCDFPTVTDVADELDGLKKRDMKAVARLITLAESQVGASGEVSATTEQALNDLKKEKQASVPILGITGTGGAGKSSLTDELVRRFLNEFPDKSMAILSVDPTKQKTGGALLGDRIRMNAIHSPNVYMRSLATRGSKTELSEALRDAISVVKAAGYDLVVVETSGIGQGDAEIADISDVAMYVMTSEFGAPSQLEKIDMIDFADIVVINKFERKGSEDALRDVKKQYQRSHLRFNEDPANMPVYGTIASQFNDAGTNRLFNVLIDTFNQKFDLGWQSTLEGSDEVVKQNVIIPPNRVQYLHDIAETVRNYHGATEEQARLARRCFQLDGTLQAVKEQQPGNEEMISKLEDLKADYERQLQPETKQILEGWQELKEKYAADEFVTKIRDKEIRTELKTRSLSGLDIPKISLPKFEDWGEIVKWVMKENVPGSFPFTAGVFPFKRKGEDPKRQFAGEGPPERTNRRFHYLSRDDDAKRLSTAFDSVTLYGEDPDHRPDIYGKVGESGVN
ncbi:MAG TPA: methylmalonyl-CoA mutase family protein, partial [Bacillales bacterium]|nr:methylmalonyl-CoA mutase family protein [Bacillales bacterium]